MGRFISVDAFPSTGQGLLGNNMFAYCNNNPVLMLDNSGTSAVLATAFAIVGSGLLGVVSQFVGGVAKNSIEGKTGTELFKNTGTWGDYTSAFLSGAFSAIPGVGTAASVVFDVAVAPAIQQGVDCAMGIQGNWNTDKYLQDIAVNGVCCAATLIATTPVPQHIRDIKDDAIASGLKGTKAYNAYLSTSINIAKTANQFLAMSMSVAKEVYKGAARKLFPQMTVY